MLLLRNRYHPPAMRLARPNSPPKPRLTQKIVRVEGVDEAGERGVEVVLIPPPGGGVPVDAVLDGRRARVPWGVPLPWGLKVPRAASVSAGYPAWPVPAATFVPERVGVRDPDSGSG